MLHVNEKTTKFNMEVLEMIFSITLLRLKFKKKFNGAWGNRKMFLRNVGNSRN